MWLRENSVFPEKTMRMLTNVVQRSPDEPKHKADYTVVSQNEEYEERRYPASTWACTTVTGLYQDSAKIDGFRHLQAYAEGHNSAHVRLSMQPPIVTRVSSDSGSGFHRKFIVSVFMCPEHTSGHPEPSSELVCLEHLPEMTVFVRSFTGIASEENWAYETKRHAEALRNKEDIRTDFYITATYESPFQLFSSRNEIWFVKFDHKQEAENKQEETVLKYGKQTVQIPSVFGWLLQAVIMYLSVMMFLLRNTFNFSRMISKNWDSIKCRCYQVTMVIRQSTSLRGVWTTAVYIFWTVRNIVLATISGAPS